MKHLLEKTPEFIRDPSSAIRKYLRSENYLVLDVETTTLDKGDPCNKDNRLLLACWYFRGRYYFCFGSEYEQELLTKHLVQCDFVVAHNTKFELGWIKRLMIKQYELLPYCTMIAEYVRHSNLNKPLDLTSCCVRHGIKGKKDKVSKMIKAGVDPENIPEDLLKTYCIQDVESTLNLFLSQRKWFSKDPTGAIRPFLTRNLFTPVLVEMEFTGMKADKERVLTIYEKANEEYTDTLAELNELTGGINTNSPAQLREYLYDKLKFKKPTDWKGRVRKTPSGEVTTDAQAIASLTAKTKDQQIFLDLYRTVSAKGDLLSKYLRKLKDCVEENDGILQFQMNQTITATQRLSSNGKHYKIQGQNMPRAFKPIFRARHPDYLIGEVDEAKLEYVAAVHLGRDEVGKADILNGVDSHAVTGSVIFKDEGWDEAEGEDRKALRTAAKAHTFKPLYGGSSGTKAQQEYYQFFKDKHQGITSTQEKWKEEAYRTKKLVTEWGMTYYFPKCQYSRSGYLEEQNKICNYPVQGFATAEIVPIAVTYQFHLMKAAGMKSFQVNTVHDSSISEVHKDETELFEQVAVYSFTTVPEWYVQEIYGIEMFVPLETEVSLGDFWNDSQQWRDTWLQ